jgi:alkaline phosphatase
VKRKTRYVWLVLLILLSFICFSSSASAAPKNVILLIGDGMGPQIVGLTIYYQKFLYGADRPLHLERLMAAGNTGYCLTYQYGTVVTDSASAATALACGVKTRDAIIGKDHEGRPMKSIVDIAHQLGKSTGLISNTRLTHATPAGFYAHIIHRDLENEIATQFVERGDIAVAFSGGAQHFIPAGNKVEEYPDLKGIAKPAGWGASKRQDARDLISLAKEKGYRIVANDRELAAFDPGSASKVLGLFSASGFPSAIDRQPQHQTGVPTLAQLTEKALKILQNNPQGFFLMVEGGQIDWVAHGNDVASVLHEMLEFDEAIGVARAFAQNNPETLIIVTADHDTGGLAIAYNKYHPPTPLKLASGETWKSKYNFGEKTIFEKMAKQKKSFLKMILDSKGNPKALQKEIEENTAFAISEEQATAILTKDAKGAFPATKDYPEFYVYSAGNPSALLGRLFGKEMSAAWAVGTHTHTPVMIFGKGPGAEKLRGLLDNTDIPKIIAREWGAVLPMAK